MKMHTRMVAALILVGLGAPSGVRAAFGPITQISLGLNSEQPNSDSAAPVVNADGTVIAFVSLADNLVPDDTNAAADVFIVDRRAGTTTRIVAEIGEFPFDSEAPAISDDGSLVAFVNDGILRVFNRDFGAVQDIVQLINQPYALSGNGRFLAIAAEDEQALVPDDFNGVTDVLVYDRLTQQYERASRPAGDGEADGPSMAPALTPDGRYVAFVSAATNLVAEPPPFSAVYVYDRIARTTVRVSGFGSGEGELFDDRMAPTLSADGRYVGYVAFDEESVAGIYVRDRTNASTVRLGVSGPTVPVDFSFNTPLSASGDARRFTFGLFGDFFENVYVFDVGSATTIVVSAALGGGIADGDSIGGRLSGNGRAVVFVSDATNLVASGPDGLTMNVFLATPSTPTCQVGDVNGDGAVDAADIPALIELIFGGSQ
jgi:hypothetical protein